MLSMKRFTYHILWFWTKSVLQNACRALFYAVSPENSPCQILNNSLKSR